MSADATHRVESWGNVNFVSAENDVTIPTSWELGIVSPKKLIGTKIDLIIINWLDSKHSQVVNFMFILTVQKYELLTGSWFICSSRWAGWFYDYVLVLSQQGQFILNSCL